MTDSALPSGSPCSRTRRLVRGLLWTTLVLGSIAGLWAIMVEVALWRGAACLEARHHEGALAWLGLAERLSCERAEVHYLLARCYRRLERFDQVSPHLRRALELGWEVSQLEREQWLALAQTGRFDEMQPHWPSLFERPGSDGPEISKAYVTNCLAWFRIADANRVLDAWAKDYPQDPEPDFQRARIAETMLRWGDAVQHYGRALELAPQRADARLGLGNALMKQGEIEKAEAQLRQAVAQRPGDVAARIAHARCLAKAGRAEESQKTLSEIVQASPDHVDALLELGTVELTAGAHAEALQHLQRAARLKPESREVIYAYANALKKNGRIEEANTCLRFVDEATKPLLKLKDLTNQLLREPENVELRLQVALITWRYKSREEGAQWLLSLLKVDPQYPPAHAALAEHYALLGDEPRAVQHRRLAGLLLPGATGPPAGRKTQSP